MRIPDASAFMGSDPSPGPEIRQISGMGVYPAKEWLRRRTGLRENSPDIWRALTIRPECPFSAVLRRSSRGGCQERGVRFPEALGRRRVSKRHRGPNLA